MKIPNGHQAMMPYIIINDAEKFAPFMEKVFGAKVTMMKKNEDGSVMHSEMDVNGSTIMFSGASEQWPQQNAHMFIYVPDADVAFKKALELNATSILELRDQDYGRSGGVTDPFGNTWWITSVK